MQNPPGLHIQEDKYGSGHRAWVDVDKDVDEVSLGLLCRTMSEESARIDIV